MSFGEEFTLITLRDDEGVREEGDWRCEELHYHARSRPQGKYFAILDGRELFPVSGIATPSKVTTRVCTSAKEGELALELFVTHPLKKGRIEEVFKAVKAGNRSRACSLSRIVYYESGEVLRREEADFTKQVVTFPQGMYPESLLPFMMRGQVFARKKPVYAWSNDRFINRVYYERRKEVMLTVPAGRFRCHLVWLYPDLNDLIRLGGLLTKLAKPFLPRYNMWFEIGGRERLIKFEGPYGPPGAPELILELCN